MKFQVAYDSAVANEVLPFIEHHCHSKGVAITKPDAAPFRQATQGVYQEFYATPAGKDAGKMVEVILNVR